jgi:hypothetical protein
VYRERTPHESRDRIAPPHHYSTTTTEFKARKNDASLSLLFTSSLYIFPFAYCFTRSPFCYLIFFSFKMDRVAPPAGTPLLASSPTQKHSIYFFKYKIQNEKREGEKKHEQHSVSARPLSPPPSSFSIPISSKTRIRQQPLRWMIS